MTDLVGRLIVAWHAKPVAVCNYTHRKTTQNVALPPASERRAYVSHYAVRQRRENGALITAIMPARTKTRITVRNAPGTSV